MSREVINLLRKEFKLPSRNIGPTRQMDTLPHKWKAVCKDRSSTNVVGKYCLFYHKGMTVTALPGTLGIMVFDRKRDAISFAASLQLLGSATTILRVLPVGRGKVPRKVSSLLTDNRLDDYYIYQRLSYFERRRARLYIQTICPPQGTRCYPAVKVQD